MPLLIPLCVIGACASDVTMVGVSVMIVFGIVGYVLNLIGSFRRAMAIFEGGPPWTILTTAGSPPTSCRSGETEP